MLQEQKILMNPDYREQRIAYNNKCSIELSPIFIVYFPRSLLMWLGLQHKQQWLQSFVATIATDKTDKIKRANYKAEVAFILVASNCKTVKWWVQNGTSTCRYLWGRFACRGQSHLGQVLESRTSISSCVSTNFLSVCLCLYSFKYLGNGGRLKNKTSKRYYGDLGHFSILQVPNLELCHDYYSPVSFWILESGGEQIFFPQKKQNGKNMLSWPNLVA